MMYFSLLVVISLEIIMVAQFGHYKGLSFSEIGSFNLTGFAHESGLSIQQLRREGGGIGWIGGKPSEMENGSQICDKNCTKVEKSTLIRYRVGSFRV